MMRKIAETIKMKPSALFPFIIIGITMLAAATFIGNRILFADQPDIENVFSIIWTVVLGVILYRLMLYVAPTKNATRAEWRRNFYGGMIFLVEILAVVTLLILAVIFSGLLTSGNPANTPLALMVAFVAALALAAPLGIRIIRVVNERLVRAERQSEYRYDNRT